MSTVRMSLFVSDTALVACEDPPCRVVFTNEGHQPADVPNLHVNPTAPEFVVEDVNGGDSRAFDPQTMWRGTGTRPLPINPGDGPWMTLGPGEQTAVEFPLSHRIRLPLPGAYAISAWFRAGLEVVQSNKQKIVVTPAQPVHSCLTSSDGGPSMYWFESWADGGATPLLFVRAARVGARFRQMQCLRVATLPEVVAPVMSVAPNGHSSGDRSVAWLHKGVFHVLDVGLEKLTRAVRSVTVSTGGGFIVEPLWKDAQTDGAQGLVWEEINHQESTLTLVDAAPDGVSVLSTVPVPFPRPMWIRGFQDSKGGRLALFLCHDGLRSSLHGLVCAGGIASPEAPLGTWPWRMRLVSAQLTRDDAIVGAVVGQPVTDDQCAPTMVCCWSLDADGRFLAGEPWPWPALDEAEFDHLEMVIDVGGRPIALVHSTQSGWACVRQDVSHRITPPIGLATTLPPSLALAPDGITAMVVWRDAWRGLIPVPVGVEIPDFLGPDFIQPPVAAEEL